MKRRAITAVVALVLTACGAQSASQVPTSSESTSSVPSPMVSESPSPTAATTASPSAPEAAFPTDTMVRALLPGIALRIEPGLSGERLGTLPEGSRSFVVSGSVEADGYTWIELAGPGLPPSSGCATDPGSELSCPIWYGWAATGDPQTGQAWFVDDPTTDCPNPTLDSRAFMLLGDVEALHCYGNQDIEFSGWLYGREAMRDLAECVGKDVAAKWLWCSDEYALQVWANDSEEVSIDIFVDPKTRRQLAYPGHWPIVVGHFDDPMASECDTATPDGWPTDPDAEILMCRSHFVLTLLGGVGP